MNALDLIAEKERLWNEGAELIAQGKAKQAASLHIAAAIKALDPGHVSEQASIDQAPKRKKRSSSTNQHAGWTAFIESVLANGPANLSTIVKRADEEGKWGGLDSNERRKRLRTSLHALKRINRVDQWGDGMWKLRKEETQ